MSAPDLSDLEVGDAFDVPTGSTLVIVGVAETTDTPSHACDGPLYEAEIRSDHDVSTVLYGVHNLRHGLEGGLEYAGRVDVDDPAEPFWCAGCGHAKRSDERYNALLVDAEVCSYGCAEAVHQVQISKRIQDDEIDRGNGIRTDGGHAETALQAVESADERLHPSVCPGATLHVPAGTRHVELKPLDHELPPDLANAGIVRAAQYVVVDKRIRGVLGETADGVLYHLRRRDGGLCATPARLEAGFIPRHNRATDRTSGIATDGGVAADDGDRSRRADPSDE